MKILPKLCVASIVLLAFLIPIVAVSDELPAPLDKTIMPGVTTISYGGQSLRFTTDIPLQVNLLALGEDRIRLRISVHGSRGEGQSGAPSNPTVDVFWEDWSNEIYNGPPPYETWEGILLTESGFTEK